MKLLQLLSLCNVCSIHTKIINNNTDKLFLMVEPHLLEII